MTAPRGIDLVVSAQFAATRSGVQPRRRGELGDGGDDPVLGASADPEIVAGVLAPAGTFAGYVRDAEPPWRRVRRPTAAPGRAAGPGAEETSFDGTVHGRELEAWRMIPEPPPARDPSAPGPGPGAVASVGPWGSSGVGGPRGASVRAPGRDDVEEAPDAAVSPDGTPVRGPGDDVLSPPQSAGWTTAGAAPVWTAGSAGASAVGPSAGGPRDRAAASSSAVTPPTHAAGAALSPGGTGSATLERETPSGARPTGPTSLPGMGVALPLEGVVSGFAMPKRPDGSRTVFLHDERTPPQMLPLLRGKGGGGATTRREQQVADAVATRRDARARIATLLADPQVDPTAIVKELDRTREATAKFSARDRAEVAYDERRLAKREFRAEARERRHSRGAEGERRRDRERRAAEIPASTDDARRKSRERAAEAGAFVKGTLAVVAASDKATVHGPAGDPAPAGDLAAWATAAVENAHTKRAQGDSEGAAADDARAMDWAKLSAEHSGYVAASLGQVVVAAHEAGLAVRSELSASERRRLDAATDKAAKSVAKAAHDAEVAEKRAEDGPPSAAAKAAAKAEKSRKEAEKDTAALGEMLGDLLPPAEAPPAEGDSDDPAPDGGAAAPAGAAPAPPAAPAESLATILANARCGGPATCKSGDCPEGTECTGCEWVDLAYSSGGMSKWPADVVWPESQQILILASPHGGAAGLPAPPAKEPADGGGAAAGAAGAADSEEDAESAVSRLVDAALDEFLKWLRTVTPGLYVTAAQRAWMRRFLAPLLAKRAALVSALGARLNELDSREPPAGAREWDRAEIDAEGVALLVQSVDIDMLARLRDELTQVHQAQRRRGDGPPTGTPELIRHFLSKEGWKSTVDEWISDGPIRLVRRAAELARRADLLMARGPAEERGASHERYNPWFSGLNESPTVRAAMAALHDRIRRGDRGWSVTNRAEMLAARDAWEVERPRVTDWEREIEKDAAEHGLGYIFLKNFGRSAIRMGTFVAAWKLQAGASLVRGALGVGVLLAAEDAAIQGIEKGVGEIDLAQSAEKGGTYALGTLVLGGAIRLGAGGLAKWRASRRAGGAAPDTAGRAPRAPGADPAPGAPTKPAADRYAAPPGVKEPVGPQVRPARPEPPGLPQRGPDPAPQRAVPAPATRNPLSKQPGSSPPAPPGRGDVATRVRSTFRDRYLSGSGGRWGGRATRELNAKVAANLKREFPGSKVVGDAQSSEEWIPGPGGSKRGGTWVDVTAMTADGRSIRVQTVDTLADGVTLTPREAAAAARIQDRFPGDELRLISKATGEELPQITRRK